MQPATPSPEYYRSRAVKEREMADSAQEEASRAIHLDLAQRYDSLAAEAESQTSGSVA
jgi:hypothetical protein